MRDYSQESIQTCIQNPVKHLKWHFLQKQLTALSQKAQS